VWTNECRINPAGTHMYVNETWAQRLSRFRLAPDGSLSGFETVAELGPGDYADGLTFDVEGGAWITCVVSNRLIRVDVDGAMQTILEDYEPDHLARAIAANAQGKLVRTLVHENHHRTLNNISSLAFAGPDLRTAHMGSILNPHLVTFRSPVAGAPPAHWNF
jgi:sugar lactone lactonase YvrE